MGFLQFRHPWLPETDGYFHVKAAYLMRTQGLFLSGFKWASLSVWRENFADTAFLFHVYLMPFTLLFADLATAAKTAIVLLSACCFASFYWILRREGARWPALWLVALLSSGPFFLWRLNVPRPQVLSSTLLLWCIHFLINGRRRPLAAMSFVYSLSYSAPFFPTVFAVIVSAHRWLAEGERDWRTPAAAFAGFALGMLVNPYCPKDFLMLYIVNFAVLKMSLFGGDKLSMGGEFFPMDTRAMLGAHPIVFGAVLAVAYFGLVTGRKAGQKTARLFPVAVTTVLMTFVWKRFTEYSVPLTLYYCALRATELVKSAGSSGYFERHPRRLAAAYAALGAFLLCCAVGSTRGIYDNFKWTRESSLKGAALYVKERAKEGDVVFTCDWDDAPELFFYNHAQRYLVFMDPVLMYYQDPAVWRRWNEAANGRLGRDTRRTIKEISGATYGICKSRFTAVHRIVEEDPEMVLEFDDGLSYAFKL